VSADSSPTTAAAVGLLALVVDDSGSMRRQLCAALARLEIRAVESGDGADAWRLLQSGTVFDLIVTDINMPRLDGLKLVGLVRSAGTHRATPVVVVTTESAEGDRRRAQGLGVNAYLVKPVRADQVIDAVRALLGLSTA
jgi:two-component system, chemotaxis family, chemotaxis protein CheY